MRVFNLEAIKTQVMRTTGHLRKKAILATDPNDSIRRRRADFEAI